MLEKKFTITVAVNNIEILQNNLYLSPDLLDDSRIQKVIKQNYTSASLAYNAAINEAENDIIIFIHQDIYLPENWLNNLKKTLTYFEKNGINWGVLGCFGSRKYAEGGLGRIYTTGLGLHGRMLYKPEQVETLDEILLIIRKSSGLKFDNFLPHFHLYGTDICMSAKQKGLTNYAIQSFCIHNTNQILALPKEYYDCYRYIKKKWQKFLPIYSSCMTITQFNKELVLKKLSELYQKILKNKKNPKYRVNNPKTILENLIKKNLRV